MLNGIVEGIAIRLNQEFGDDVAIYTESVEQGLREPCFFLFLLPTSQEQVIGNRYFRRHPFDVHYFSSTKNKNTEVLDVVDRLNDALEYVTLNDDLIRGTKMHHEVVDGVLHFFVEYNFHVIKENESDDPMETLTVNNDVEG